MQKTEVSLHQGLGRAADGRGLGLTVDYLLRGNSYSAEPQPLRVQSSLSYGSADTDEHKVVNQISIDLC
jgi:hypothetical protein